MPGKKEVTGKKFMKQHLQIIQFNLQVEDTKQMDAQKIAESVICLGANAVVLNVGGIYAWYHSQVPFHHVNEYLPKGKELLREMIQECHARGIQVIGRFDFSKTEDTTYLQHPEWFVQDEKGEPVCYGSRRMGNWSLLMSTCVNGGYRGEEFAVPVLKEAMEAFKMDGIFLNAPQMEPCFCTNCRRKYYRKYKKELPLEKANWEKDWMKSCLKENIGVLYQAVKETDNDMPFILYYGTYKRDGSARAENLDEKYQTADRICTEAQNILSDGKERLADKWKPTLNMKLGQPEVQKPPFGIIHSCPGMDWRHTGMPAAEYEWWMSQIVPAGGEIWHSLTGFDETITDRRMLKVVKRVNEKAKAAGEAMQGASPVKQVLLLWDGSEGALGYVDAMIQSHIPFDICDVWHLEEKRMQEYPLILMPDSFPVEGSFMESLQEYVALGGKLFVQVTKKQEGISNAWYDFLGIAGNAVEGKNKEACYGIFEEEGLKLKKNMERMVYLPVKGDMLLSRKAEEWDILMTLVPPFAPKDGVGAPPERASMPVKHTELALLSERIYGKGRVMTCLFDLSKLIWKVGLEDQKLLFENCIDKLLGEDRSMDAEELPESVYMYEWETESTRLVHLVNTEGQRPVRQCHPWQNLKLKLKEKRTVKRVGSLLEKGEVSWKQEAGWLIVTLKELKVWDMIEIKTGEED